MSASDPKRTLDVERERLVVCTAGVGQLTIAGSGAWTADNAMRLEAVIEDARPTKRQDSKSTWATSKSWTRSAPGFWSA